MRAEIGGRESKFTAQLSTGLDRADNAVFAAQHRRRFREISPFHRPPDLRTADDGAMDLHRPDDDHKEVIFGTELLQ